MFSLKRKRCANSRPHETFKNAEESGEALHFDDNVLQACDESVRDTSMRKGVENKIDGEFRVILRQPPLVAMVVIPLTTVVFIAV